MRFLLIVARSASRVWKPWTGRPSSFTLRLALSTAERERTLERINEGRLETKAKGVGLGRKSRIRTNPSRTPPGQELGATEIACMSF